MKKIMISIVLLSTFLFTACDLIENQVANNDWSYSLPNGYAIWHINSHKIICVKQNTLYDASSVVDEFVLEFCYNDVFVCLKCVEISNEINAGIEDSNLFYYILNTEDNNIYGKLTEEEYLLNLQELLITDLSDWIPTNPRPNGAVFS